MLLVAFLFLFAGCKENHEDMTNNQEVSIKENYTTIFFLNVLDNKPLYNFRFGTCSNKEELPIDIIFQRDSLGLVNETFVRIKHSFRLFRKPS